MPTSPNYRSKAARRPSGTPNYPARRMLVSAVAITVVVLVATMAWGIFHDDDGPGVAVASAAWDHVALIDRVHGSITVIDRDGTPVADVDGLGRIHAVHTHRSRVAVVGTSRILLGSLDEAAGLAQPPSNNPTSTPSTPTPASTPTPTPAPTPASPVPLGVPATATIISTTTTPPTTTPTTGEPTRAATTPTLPTSVATTPTSVPLPRGFTEVPIDRRAVVTRLRIANRLVLAVGTPNGGNTLIVDGDSGTVIDIGALAGQAAPLMFVDTLRFDPAGTMFAIADALTFQTIVVRTAPVPTIEYFADVPLAISERLVVTNETVGQRADLGFFQPDGNVLTVVATELIADAALIGDALIAVTADGDLQRILATADDPTSLGTIAMPANGSVHDVALTGHGERIVVIGDIFQTVIGPDGTAVATAEFATVVTPAPIAPDWDCIALGGTAGNTTIYSQFVALDDGAVLADLDGADVIGTTANGCGLLVERSGTVEFLTPDGSIEIGDVRTAIVAPDGTAVVRVLADNTVELVGLDGDTLGQPLDLTALTDAAGFDVAFLTK